MAEEEESFKITDRRGRAKENDDRAEPSAPASGPSRLSTTGALGAEPAPPRGPSAERGGEGVSLQGLFVMLASSALINLGEAADPLTGDKHVDLDQAREAVDMLVLLKAKTAGNRTDQESRLLEDILYDLQMRFVRATKGKAMR
jgi:Domain of unknown function (DUF1844)